MHSVPPTISAANAVRIIKTNTAMVLLREFSELSRAQSVWTRSYFASTAGEVSSETIKQYMADTRLASGSSAAARTLAATRPRP